MTQKSPILVALVCLAVLSACSQPKDRVEITQTTTRSETRPVPRVNTPTEERFQLARGQMQAAAGEGVPMTAGAEAAGEPPSAAVGGGQSGLFDYTVPEGWTEVAPTQFRNPNFVLGPNGEIECYVTVLPGEGGGLLVNANRWRGQMGQPLYSEEEFAKLPRASILNQPAAIVDFTGEYLAMGASTPQPNTRLVGALLKAPMAAIFIKMIGPDEMVEAQKDNFARFAQSLRLKGMSGPATPPAEASAGAPAAGQAAPPESSAGGGPAPTPAGFTWTTPEGWHEVNTGSPMRLVTFRFGPNGSGECYVVTLAGTGGGRLENFNRWLAQVGEPPLDESELELQPKVELFGEQVPMLVAKGTYTGMGGESRENQVLMGAVGHLDDQSVFIKLVAPENVASSEWDTFKAFCASLKRN